MQYHTDTLYRQSPVTLKGRPQKVRRINGFKVVLEHEDESQKTGPTLTDLSHLAKWDFQSKDLCAFADKGEIIPSKPGECRIQNDRCMFRMNRTQIGIWHICAGDAPELPDDASYTDITDAWALFGLAGKAIPALFEQITELDLFSSSGFTPWFFQGPIFHVSSRIAVINRSRDSVSAMIAFPSGYGPGAAEALLDTGSGIGLHLTGMNAFFNSLNRKIE